MAVIVALNDNFRANLEKELSIVVGSKSEAPKLSPNYVAGSSLGANKILIGAL